MDIKTKTKQTNKQAKRNETNKQTNNNNNKTTNNRAIKRQQSFIPNHTRQKRNECSRAGINLLTIFLTQLLRTGPWALCCRCAHTPAPLPPSWPSWRCPTLPKVQPPMTPSWTAPSRPCPGSSHWPPPRMSRSVSAVFVTIMLRPESCCVGQSKCNAPTCLSVITLQSSCR